MWCPASQDPRLELATGYGSIPIVLTLQATSAAVPGTEARRYFAAWQLFPMPNLILNKAINFDFAREGKVGMAKVTLVVWGFAMPAVPSDFSAVLKKNVKGRNKPDNI